MEHRAGRMLTAPAVLLLLSFTVGCDRTESHHRSPIASSPACYHRFIERDTLLISSISSSDAVSCDYLCALCLSQ
eukprot:scaffold264142_cov29-Prasinocladus_malaysianus.AAC.1